MFHSGDSRKKTLLSVMNRARTFEEHKRIMSLLGKGTIGIDVYPGDLVG